MWIQNDKDLRKLQRINVILPLLRSHFLILLKSATGDQAFKHMSLYGLLLLKPPQLVCSDSPCSFCVSCHFIQICRTTLRVSFTCSTTWESDLGEIRVIFLLWFFSNDRILFLEYSACLKLFPYEWCLNFMDWEMH